MADENEKQIILTKEGLKKLEDELQDLKVVRRKEVAAKIKEARGQGDLSENAEYDAAKEEQAEIEARIIVIEKMLRNVHVIEDNGNAASINLGSKVKVYDEDFEEEEIYTIVGSAEADPFEGKISNESPVGSALIGHEAGETVEITTPNGVSKIKILEIL